MPVVAFDAMVTDAPSDQLYAFTSETVIPSDGEKLTAVAPVRLSPKIVRLTVVPCVPWLGIRKSIVGAGWAWFTVKVSVFDVPAGVVTDTWRAPAVAPDEMLIDAVTWVADD